MREPESHVEVEKDANWCATMEEEMCALAENETWDLVDAPKGVKPIGCMWVYKVKYNTNNSVNRYKARLVVKGYTQQHDIDYDETFAPVVNMTTVCVLLVVVAAKGWYLHKMDIKKAFLQGELEEHVYMVQPLGFHSETKTSAVCRLKKSLYGRKQAPCVWNVKIMPRLGRIEFSLSKSDSSLLVQTSQTRPLSILLYVDDLVIAGVDLGEILRVKSQLAASFDMKDLGDLHTSSGSK